MLHVIQLPRVVLSARHEIEDLSEANRRFANSSKIKICSGRKDTGTAYVNIAPPQS